MAGAKKIEKVISDFMHVSDLTVTQKDLDFVECTFPSTTKIEAENGKRIDLLRLTPFLKPSRGRAKGIKRVPGVLRCSKKRGKYHCSLCELGPHTCGTGPEYKK